MILDDLKGGEQRARTVGQLELDEDDLAHARVIGQVLNLLEARGDALLLLLGGLYLDEQRILVHGLVVVHADRSRRWPWPR